MPLQRRGRVVAARAESHRNGLLSALRAHTKTQQNDDSLWRTRAVHNFPGGIRPLLEVGVVRARIVVFGGSGGEVVNPTIDDVLVTSEAVPRISRVVPSVQ